MNFGRSDGRRSISAFEAKPGGLCSRPTFCAGWRFCAKPTAVRGRLYVRLK
jgi:hypothetical protein